MLQVGLHAISVGVNPGSAPPAVPKGLYTHQVAANQHTLTSLEKEDRLHSSFELEKCLRSTGSKSVISQLYIAVLHIEQTTLPLEHTRRCSSRAALPCATCLVRERSSAARWVWMSNMHDVCDRSRAARWVCMNNMHDVYGPSRAAQWVAWATWVMCVTAPGPPAECNIPSV